MEQYYNALQCFLRKEQLEAPVSPAFRTWIDEVSNPNPSQPSPSP
jgi:hypothetical protein